MQKTLNSVQVEQSVQPAHYPPKEGTMAQPKVAHTIMIRPAVGECLQKNLDAMRLNEAKLPSVDPKKGFQAAEADVYMSNKTIRNFGLPVAKQVLDIQQYLLRLDRQSNIAAYGLKDLVGKRV